MFIEHIWTVVWLNVRINHDINNVPDFTEALIHEWNAFPNDIIRRYTRLICSKVFTLHHRRPGHNPY